MPRPEVAAARKLRRQMTLPEVLLWQRLRGAKAGAKFRRQHPIGPYVTDFYCSNARLVVEIDGEVHGEAVRLERDGTRDRFLADNGYRVVRILAADVLKDADEVAASVGLLVTDILPGTGRGTAVLSLSKGGGGGGPATSESPGREPPPPLAARAVPLPASGEDLR